jgi:hypothetical protein
MLRRAAEAARKEALKMLRKKLLTAHAKEQGRAPEILENGGPPQASETALILHQPSEPQGKQSAGTRPKQPIRQLEEMISFVENCEHGAFARFSRQPWLTAALLPAGGAGLLNLLQWL